MKMKLQSEEIPARLSFSPTFSSYSSSSNGLAEIAARVVRELGEEAIPDHSDYSFDSESQGSIFHNVDDEDEDVADEFEFAIPFGESDSSTRPANEIFYDGQIRPAYPVFNMNLLGSIKNTTAENLKTTTKTVRRLPLRKLMNEERETSSSSSDDLDGVPSDMYCVWSPKTEEKSPGRCEKSNSTGSLKRWKLRNLLYNYSYNRSKSDGDDIFWTSIKNKSDRDRAGNVWKKKEGISSNGRNMRAMKESEKRRSYLPYKQGLVGCVADVNAIR